MRQAFLDGAGKLRQVEQLPPLPLLEYLDWLGVLETWLRESQRSAESLYLEDTLFRQICDRCLELHQVPPLSIPLDLALDLVLVRLPKLNTPPTGEVSGEDGEKVSARDWAYSMVAAMLELEGTRGAIATASTVPTDLLSGILKAHAKQAKSGKDDPPLDAPEYQEILAELDRDLLGVPL